MTTFPYALAASALSALIILVATVYAATFAWGRLLPSPRLTLFSHGCFVALLVITGLLLRELQVSGLWYLAALLLLAGYFAAPRVIWHLCVATHQQESTSITGKAGEFHE